MTPIKTPGLLWDAKAVTLGSLYNEDQPSSANARFNMPGHANAIYVGTTGNVSILLIDGKTSILFTAPALGIWMGMPPFIHINPAGSGTSAGAIVVGITSG